jgi:membrane-bound lytic murein transglycosylase F
MKKYLFVVIPVFFLFVYGWRHRAVLFAHKEVKADLVDITKRGTITVTTSNNPSDYFLYKGEPLGFQFEMLEALGEYLGLKVDVVVCNNPGDNLDMLRSGKCDMIASSWNLSLKNNVASSSIPLLESDLLLVQRKTQNGQKEGVRKVLVKDMKELAGKSVYVPLLSAQAEIMRQLADETRGHVQVVELPQYSQEKLVELVANGELEYTICNSILAETYRSHYPSLDFNTVVKKAEPIVWMFRQSSPELTAKVNQWLLDYKKSTRFVLLIDKYFSQQNKWMETYNRYSAYKDKRISDYDELIRKYALTINWDWRLLASLIYQESRFHPAVKSSRGAYGIMQMMPATQDHFGIDTTANVELQIKAGVKYIKFLDAIFAKRVFDHNERILFILASYNVGPGHIFDAQKLAYKIGKDPLRWFNSVDSCLLSKSKPKNYNDPLVEFGYCKGLETCSFVREVMERYHHYQNVMGAK